MSLGHTSEAVIRLHEVRRRRIDPRESNPAATAAQAAHLGYEGGRAPPPDRHAPSTPCSGCGSGQQAHNILWAEHGDGGSGTSTII